MNSCQATWEDAENNRHVELVVNYRLDAKRVDINDVTPTRVNFLCPTSGKKRARSALDQRRPPRFARVKLGRLTLPQELPTASWLRSSTDAEDRCKATPVCRLVANQIETETPGRKAGVFYHETSTTATVPLYRRLLPLAEDGSANVGFW
jgi:hypothetical protein